MSASLFTIFATGLVAGAGHVFAGPDHLAAIAPLAAHSPRSAWRSGLSWGCGHTGGVWALAVLALLSREMLPVEWLSSIGERLVGVVLIGIGLWGFRKASITRIHTHEHLHDGVRHTHVHLHTAHAAHDPRRTASTHSHSHAALSVGILHGVAGTSHLLGVLPALALRSRVEAGAYLLAFGVGSIVAMTVFAGVLGHVARRWAGAETRAFRTLVNGCSAAAIVVGIVWIYSSGLAPPTTG